MDISKCFDICDYGGARHICCVETFGEAVTVTVTIGTVILPFKIWNLGKKSVEPMNQNDFNDIRLSEFEYCIKAKYGYLDFTITCIQCKT